MDTKYTQSKRDDDGDRGAVERPITAAEAVLLFLLLMAGVLCFAGGVLWQFLLHDKSHHTTNGIGVCQSARLCDTYAPRALCSKWQD